VLPLQHLHTRVVFDGLGRSREKGGISEKPDVNRRGKNQDDRGEKALFFQFRGLGAVGVSGHGLSPCPGGQALSREVPEFLRPAEARTRPFVSPNCGRSSSVQAISHMESGSIAARLGGHIAVALTAVCVPIAAHAQAPVSVAPQRPAQAACLPVAGRPLPSCAAPRTAAEWAEALLIDALQRSDASDWANVRDLLGREIARVDAIAEFDARVRARGLLGQACEQLGLLDEASSHYRAVIDLWADPSLRLRLRSLGTSVSAITRVREALDEVGRATFFFAETERRRLVEGVTLTPYAATYRPSTKTPGEMSASEREADWTARWKEQDAIITYIDKQVWPWIERKQAAIESAERAYLLVLRIGPSAPPRWAVASAAAAGAMWSDLAQTLRAVPIPTGPHERALEARYHFEPPDGAAPLLLRARNAYELCYRRSIQGRWFDAASQQCEEWLSRHVAGEFSRMRALQNRPLWPGSWRDDRRAPAANRGGR
jgi:hypothetical protein